MINALETQTLIEAVQEDLSAMPVREKLSEMFWPSGAMGFYIPTRRAWRAEMPQRIGANLKQLCEGGQTVMRIYSLNDAGLLRREQAEGRLSGLVFTRIASGGPLHAAEVADVSEVDQGHNRSLPLLHLKELNPNPDQRPLVMSVPDLAYHLQGGEARIELATEF